MASKRNAAYSKTILKNGLRVVTEKNPYAQSISLGIWIDVGSGDEMKEENGISHFIEHMFFKGTRSRSAKKIASSLESRGGILNAFTSREQTCYHAIILDEHLEQAIDVLSDILMNSTLSRANIEREKSVVIEEIREINETPSDHIHELFSDCFWRGQPLGRPIMGTEEKVRSFDRHLLKSYIEKHYRAGRVAVAAAGNVSHRKLVTLIKERLNLRSGAEDRHIHTKSPTGFSMEFFTNDSNQTHICLGFPGVCFTNPDKYPLLVLHTYLGGGMSSVLFQKIREEKGMAYTVYTFPDFYRNGGIFGAYLATDRKHLHEAVEIIIKEFRKLKTTRLSQERLDKIKDQFKGNLLLGMESTSGRMSRLGRQEILAGNYVSPREAVRLINRIKTEDVQAIARRIFDHNNMTITALGSAKHDDLGKVDWSLL